MNRICYAALLICMAFNTSRAQYEVGHQSLSFYDEPRDRDVTIEVYYPADSPGDDVPFTTGSFPLVVFGHGFVMPWDDYQNIWNFLVPTGYCMAFLTTESGIVPDHENYGLDFVFIANSLMAENDNDASIFYQHLTDKQGFVGHSMGGGAAWLAASGNTMIETVVGLAPAETNPSAIAAATNVTIPALVVSGSSDEVTPPDAHHLPIYNGTASVCKAFVSLTEGSHCGYADEGTLCDLGEFLFDGMSRETQQEITHQLLLYWLGYFLKNQEDAGSAFEAYCEENADTELTTNCTLTGVTEHEVAQLLYPVPSNDWFSIGITGTLQLFDVMGKEVLNTKHVAGAPVYCGQFEAGIYYVHMTHANGQVRLPLLIQHP